MKKQIASALSGLALIVSTSACANVSQIKKTNYSEIKQCLDNQYDYDLRCFEDNLESVFENVYPIEISAVKLKDGKEKTRILGEGTGLLLKNGYVLTVYHVGEAPKAQLMSRLDEVVRVSIVNNKKKYPLTSILSDPREDLALMKISGKYKGLKEYESSIGTASKLKIGNLAFLVGNSMGLGINIREGIISQLKTSLPGVPTTSFVISNGANEGDSGGPVFALNDGEFELVGAAMGVAEDSQSLTYVSSLDGFIKKLDNLLGDENPLKRK